MYSVTKLYVVKRNNIEVLNTTDLTPVDFQQLNALNTVLYVAIIDSKTKKQTGLNYSRLITDNAICSKQTWNEFNADLTDSIVLGYKETIPGYIPGMNTPSNQVISWDAMNSLNTFNLNYADYQSGQEGIYPFRWNLKDMKISLQEGAKTYPDLGKCLPIVNGLICRPVYRKETNFLYALGGAHLFWQTGEHITPEIQLLDFSELGNIEVCNIYAHDIRRDEKDFALYFMNRTDSFSFETEWYLSSSWSLHEYTPIIVLAGIPIFPDKYQTVSEFSLKFSMNTQPFHRALAYRKYLQAEPNSQAEIAYSTEDLNTYFQNQLTKDPASISKECFVLLVKRPRLYVTRVPLDVWRNGITINLYTEEGMLQHDATGTIRVYHKDTLSDRKELTLQNSEEIYMADNLFEESQLAFIKPDCLHQDFKNIQQSNCTMLYLMG